MARYRRKPVEVEAVQLRWDNWGEMCDFAGIGKLSDGKPEGCYIKASKLADGQPEGCYVSTGKMGLQIPTKGGVITAKEGDWIIKGVKGELYPCDPESFSHLYDEIVEDVFARPACRGIEIEPGVYSGCSAKETGADDCPVCGRGEKLTRDANEAEGG